MNSFFLKYRLTRMGKRVTADSNLKASLRARLVQAGYLPGRTSLWVRMRVATASAGMLFLGFGGMASYAYASDAVLPDTPLYPFRQSIEALEVKLAPTSEVRAKVLEKQAERRQKEAHLLEDLHKPLPALHAAILKEEREERAALRAERASSTRARRESLLRLRVPSLRDAQKKGTEKNDEKEEGQSPKGLRGLPFVTSSSILPIRNILTPSSTRSMRIENSVLRREDQKKARNQERKNEKPSQNRERIPGRQRIKEGR